MPELCLTYLFPSLSLRYFKCFLAVNETAARLTGLLSTTATVVTGVGLGEVVQVQDQSMCRRRLGLDRCITTVRGNWLCLQRRGLHRKAGEGNLQRRCLLLSYVRRLNLLPLLEKEEIREKNGKSTYMCLVA